MIPLYSSIRTSSVRISRTLSIFSLILIALLMVQTTWASPVSQPKSGTDIYLNHQLQRLLDGKKISTDPNLVPMDFWNRESQNQVQNVYRWPSYYFGLSDSRTDSNGNGLRECRFKIDFSGFIESGIYNSGDVLTFESELRRTISMYNEALKNVGLEFLEVSDGTHHLVIEASSFPDELDGVVSQATLFGAWSGDTAVFQIRRDYPNLNAFLSLTDNGAPTALYKRSPGNPYSYIFSSDTFKRTNAEGESIFAFAISNIFQRELGHLIGLIEPWTAYLHSTASEVVENYLIDWLAWPTIKGLPPKPASFSLGSENFSNSNWSRLFMNTFMDEEALFYQIYPDIPPTVKAFIAHYYARYNYEGAQTLLDQAINEQETYSWLAVNNAIQEVEDNNSLENSMTAQIGLPIIGALSSFDIAGTTMEETYQDAADWFKINVVSADIGRELVCTIGHATTIDRDARIEVYNNQGQMLITSDDEEYPEIRYDIQTIGIYYVVVKRSPNDSYTVVRDYLLSIFFSDGEPPFAPTITPTPTFAPSPTPTPYTIPLLTGTTGEKIFGLGPVKVVVYSPEGLSLATAGGQELILWSSDTGMPTKRFIGHSDDILALAFSPDGTMLASSSQDGTIKIWSVATGTELLSFFGHNDAVNDVVFSTDNTKILTCSDDETAKVWDVQTSELILTYTGHRSAVNTIDASPDGLSVLTGSKDNSAKLWNLSTGETQRTFSGHSSAVQSVAFSTNGDAIFTGSLDTTAKLWDIQTGAVLNSFKSGSVNSVDLSTDGVTVAIGGSGGAKLANLTSGEFTYTLLNGNAKILSLAFSPNGTRVAIVGDDNSLQVFDAATGEKLQSLSGHTSGINAAAFSPDGLQVVSGGEDNLVRVWQERTGSILRTFDTVHTDVINAIAYSPDGSKVITGSDDNTAILWDSGSGEVQRIFLGHTGSINAVVFTPDGSQVLTGSSDNTVRLWNISSGKTVNIYDQQTASINALTISPNGVTFLLADDNGMVAEWNILSGEPVYALEGHGIPALSVASSLDGSIIAAGFSNKMVYVWDHATRDLMMSFSAPGVVNAIAFSPIKPWILVGADETIKLWNLEQMLVLDEFKGHNATVNSIVFSPDGRSFLSGGSDGSLRIWDIAETVDATPTPTATSTATPTYTPTPTFTNTPTFTPTATATPTFTATPTPTAVPVDVPANSIFVTDTLQTTEDLLGGTDIDDDDYRQLAVRWNIEAENILSYHIYVRTNDGDPVFIGQSRDPEMTFFNWTEPQFGNFYSFQVYAIIDGADSVPLTTKKKVFYQTAELPTPTPTVGSIIFDVPENSIVVTDNLWSTENLIGSFDTDDANQRSLTIRWNMVDPDVIDYHVYVKINDGDPSYVGRTGTTDISYLDWLEPQFGNRYHFMIFGLKDGAPFTSLVAEDEIFYESTFNPTPTPTATATATPTPTNTPVNFFVPANKVYVTDDFGTTDNLVGLYDKDDESDRALAIHWNFSEEGLIDYHVYVSVQGSVDFFLAHTGDGNVRSIEWRENGAEISQMFLQGPQFGSQYSFSVFGIRQDLSATLIRTDSVILYEAEGNPIPTSTPTPTVTPTPRIAANSVIVADHTHDFIGLSNGEDYDIGSNRDLVIRWNFVYDDVTDYHLYVAVNGGDPEYLGRTASAVVDYFEWKVNSPKINPKYWNGPEFNKSYQFYLYILFEDGSNDGPFTHNGPVKFLEWIEP